MCISNTFLVDHVLGVSYGILKNCITFMYSNLSFIYLFSSKAMVFWTLFLKRIDTLLKPLSRFYNKMIVKSLLICSFEHLDSLYLKAKSLSLISDTMSIFPGHKQYCGSAMVELV